jgi:hypothetical protein
VSRGGVGRADRGLRDQAIGPRFENPEPVLRLPGGVAGRSGVTYAGVPASASVSPSMDMSSSFRETTAVPRARQLCWHKDQAPADASSPAASNWRATSCIRGLFAAAGQPR